MRGATYEDLCYETLVLSGVLMKKHWLHVEGRWVKCVGRRERVILTEKRARGDARSRISEVKRQTYAHYMD